VKEKNTSVEKEEGATSVKMAFWNVVADNIPISAFLHPIRLYRGTRNFDYNDPATH